jgi:hypothetical protein
MKCKLKRKKQKFLNDNYYNFKYCHIPECICCEKEIHLENDEFQKSIKKICQNCNTENKLIFYPDTNTYHISGYIPRTIKEKLK